MSSRAKQMLVSDPAPVEAVGKKTTAKKGKTVAAPAPAPVEVEAPAPAPVVVKAPRKKKQAPAVAAAADAVEDAPIVAPARVPAVPLKRAIKKKKASDFHMKRDRKLFSMIRRHVNGDDANSVITRSAFRKLFRRTLAASVADAGLSIRRNVSCSPAACDLAHYHLERTVVDIGTRAAKLLNNSKQRQCGPATISDAIELLRHDRHKSMITLKWFSNETARRARIVELALAKKNGGETASA